MVKVSFLLVCESVVGGVGSTDSNSEGPMRRVGVFGCVVDMTVVVSSSSRTAGADRGGDIIGAVWLFMLASFSTG